MLFDLLFTATFFFHYLVFGWLAGCGHVFVGSLAFFIFFIFFWSFFWFSFWNLCWFSSWSLCWFYFLSLCCLWSFNWFRWFLFFFRRFLFFLRRFLFIASLFFLRRFLFIATLFFLLILLILPIFILSLVLGLFEKQHLALELILFVFLFLLLGLVLRIRSLCRFITIITIIITDWCIILLFLDLFLLSLLQFLLLFFNVFFLLFFFLHVADFLFLLLCRQILLWLFAVREFLQLSDEKAIEIVHVWVYAFAEVHGGSEALLLERGEARLSNFQAGLDQFDVPVPQGKLNNCLIFLNRNGTCGVTDIEKKRV